MLKFAAIDIGSNAVRLQIARLNDSPEEPFKRVEFVRVPLRLGDDAFQKGKISKDKRRTFYNAMQGFKLLMDAFEVKSYMACATSALREARNGNKIVKKVQDEFGLKIDIIDGRRESQLILRSIMQYLKPDQNYLTIDVGGGSTEMTVIQNMRAYDSVSFDVGTVRLLDNGIKEENWKALEHYVRDHIGDIQNSRAIATSGTINKIANIINPTSDIPSISFDELDRFYHTVKRMSQKDLIDVYKLNPDRADVIEHAAYIYLRILKWASIDKLFAPSAGLKDGILYELLGRHGKA